MPNVVRTIFGAENKQTHRSDPGPPSRLSLALSLYLAANSAIKENQTKKQTNRQTNKLTVQILDLHPAFLWLCLCIWLPIQPFCHLLAFSIWHNNFSFSSVSHLRRLSFLLICLEK